MIRTLGRNEMIIIKISDIFGIVYLYREYFWQVTFFPPVIGKYWLFCAM